jgi:PIN domain nuclease of toxin-antitoxin system
MPSVLDASAYLAYVLDEPGADRVEEAMEDGATISTVNVAEILTRLVDRTPNLASRLAVQSSLAASGTAIMPGVFDEEPFTLADAALAASLRPVGRPYGLSLGDRACLALGRRLRLPVLTSDRIWGNLDPARTHVTVQIIR